MRPTQPGWYWYWQTTDSGPTIVGIDLDMVDEALGIETLLVWFDGNEVPEPLSSCAGTFLGPLVPPERPKA